MLHFCTKCPNLDIHISSHTGQKPYLCHTCSIQFRQKVVLTKHSRIYTSDHPQHCSVCNKCFITHSALKFQYTIQTGDKPYTGATCQNSFTYSGYFMQYLCYSVVKMALCVRLWEVIQWADQFEETCDTTQWWETFALSLWWLCHYETWSENTYWNTAFCKTVILCIHVFWRATITVSHSDRGETSPQQYCLLNWYIWIGIVLFYVNLYLFPL